MRNQKKIQRKSVGILSGAWDLSWSGVQFWFSSDIFLTLPLLILILFLLILLILFLLSPVNNPAPIGSQCWNGSNSGKDQYNNCIVSNIVMYQYHQLRSSFLSLSSSQSGIYPLICYPYPIGANPPTLLLPQYTIVYPPMRLEQLQPPQMWASLTSINTLRARKRTMDMTTKAMISHPTSTSTEQTVSVEVIILLWSMLSFLWVGRWVGWCVCGRGGGGWQRQMRKNATKTGTTAPPSLLCPSPPLCLLDPPASDSTPDSSAVDSPPNTSTFSPNPPTSMPYFVILPASHTQCWCQCWWCFWCLPSWLNSKTLGFTLYSPPILPHAYMSPLSIYLYLCLSIHVSSKYFLTLLLHTLATIRPFPPLRHWIAGLFVVVSTDINKNSQ